MVKIMRCDFCGKITLDYYIVDIWGKNYAPRKGVKKLKRFDCCNDCYDMKFKEKIKNDSKKHLI